jgi:hypothetical protein
MVRIVVAFQVLGEAPVLCCRVKMRFEYQFKTASEVRFCYEPSASLICLSLR